MLFNNKRAVYSFGDTLRQGLSMVFVALLAMLLSVQAIAQQANQQAEQSSSSQTGPQDSGASPGGTSQPANGHRASDQQQPAQSAPQNESAPVGTAVAPYEKGVGVAASRPAGVVIAPAKQRRTRSFLIKVGLVIGAAVAVGTVIGLSKASPSEPSH